MIEYVIYYIVTNKIQKFPVLQTKDKIHSIIGMKIQVLFGVKNCEIIVTEIVHFSKD